MTSWMIALRGLARRRTFALVAVTLLAAGIAANTTIFSLVATIFLKPLPYPAADRLTFIWEANSSKQEPISLLAPVRLEDWNRLNRTFSALAGFYSDTKTEHTGSTPERVSALSVSPRYFEVYATPPALGRTFRKVEEVFGGPKAAVLSYHYWTSRFGQSSAVLGKRLRLGEDTYTVVGVMPSSFVPSAVDMWLPAALNPFLMGARDQRFYTGVGRLKPGIPLPQGEEDLRRVERQLGNEFPQTDRGWGVTVSDMKQQIVGGDKGRFVWLALAAVGLLLLLACSNLAALMLGHIYGRAHELAVRTSLGATRWQLVAIVLRETSLLVTAGVLLGLLASSFLLTLAGRVLTTLPRLAELQMDWRSFFFAAFLGAMTLFFVGLVPALQATRSRFTASLGRTGRSDTRERHSVQAGLLVGQFALTVVLLMAAGLLGRSYQRLLRLNAGFQADRVMTFHLSAEWAEDRAAVGQLQRNLIQTLQNQPGVVATGLTNFLPTDEATLRYQYQVDGLLGDETGMPASSSGGSGRNVFTAGERTVSGGYLRALQIPLLAGTSCPDVPMPMTEPRATALVNGSFAKQFAPGRNLLGRHLHILGSGLNVAYEISGVVGDVREDTLRTPPVPYVYVCSSAGGWPDPEYVVRTRSENPEAFVGSLRSVARRLAPDRAIFGLQTMQAHLDTALQTPRLTTQLIAGFSGAAVLLAGYGLYSLCMLIVLTRTREIGTRMALGARPQQVASGLLAGTVRTLLAGIVLGMAGAVLVGTLLHSMLFGVSAFDPVLLLAVCGLLGVICLGAMLLPVWRAATLDPVQALREG